MKENSSGAAVPPLPTKADILLQLAGRCERGDASRELDVRIFLSINNPDILVIDDSAARFPRPHRHVKARSIWNDDWAHWNSRADVEGVASELNCPHYTTSIDAAVTLVPSGGSWIISRGRLTPDEPLYGVSVYSDEAGDHEAGRSETNSSAAACVCAAALRARAATEETPSPQASAERAARANTNPEKQEAQQE